ncbi:phospholipid scramblase 2-like isoform X2 [Ctenopharyngodon idella]|uniref:phospholipid scramblase 2-like isoform X2 n=1 Tax=Ctenopharyngodon idella TaxID=7959 RepID=UPI00222E9E1A|nr:phospholipid scramblase 2-like isoform X2 [Ctenopharyngodon idella]
MSHLFILSAQIQSNMELSALEDTAMIPSPDLHHCPSHLETLTRIDKLFVHKEQSCAEGCAEDCCGIKFNNRYTVKNDIGESIFTILEDNNCCNRTFCAAARSFKMSVFNYSNQEIIRLVRPFVCNCWGHKLEVQSPPDVTIGYVRQNFNIFLPKLTVENERGEPAFKIAGPCVASTCCMNQSFQLVSLNEAVTDSKIFKPFCGCCPKAGVDFVVRFPSNLEVKMKATLLGACILIDCLYYGIPFTKTITTAYFRKKTEERQMSDDYLPNYPPMKAEEKRIIDQNMAKNCFLILHLLQKKKKKTFTWQMLSK